MDNKIPSLVLPSDEEAVVEQSVQAADAVTAAPAAAAVQAAPAAKEKVEPVAAEEDSLNFDNLSEQEQAAVLAFVERIDITDSETVLKYGNAAQMKISDPEIRMVYLAESGDTRYEKYSVLRSLHVAEEVEARKVNASE